MTSLDALPEKVAREDAALRVVSLQGLLDRRQSSQDDLLKACTDLGFFYLDCRDGGSAQVMEDVQNMYLLSTSFFDLSQAEKSEWLVDRDHDEHLGGLTLKTPSPHTCSKRVLTNGRYKPAGHGNGPVEGVKDGFEGLMVSQDPSFRKRFPDYRAVMMDSSSNIRFLRSVTRPCFQGPQQSRLDLHR